MSVDDLKMAVDAVRAGQNVYMFSAYHINGNDILGNRRAYLSSGISGGYPKGSYVANFGFANTANYSYGVTLTMVCTVAGGSRYSVNFTSPDGGKSRTAQLFFDVPKDGCAVRFSCTSSEQTATNITFISVSKIG